ncbi:hypothetical protein CDV36_014177, partial [Fusarium kuroshium]
LQYQDTVNGTVLACQISTLIVHEHLTGQLNERSLRDLLANGLTDDDIPFFRHDFDSFRLDKNNFPSFTHWGEAGMEVFLDKQWVVLAPILDLNDGQSLELRLEEGCALELSSCEEVACTHVGRVFSAEIPSREAGIPPRHVAVKQFINSKAYMHERCNFYKIRRINNIHLIKSLATCDDIHCIIFPWAKHGNLKQYWEEESYRSLPILIWSIKQLAGLASALRDLHEVKCCHGDLEPSNILYFEDGGGVLKIADLGKAQVYDSSADPDEDEAVMLPSKRVYEGPEIYWLTNGHKSLKYDCWSMGCVILEFLIWLLYDWRAVDGFRSSRVSAWNTFYCLKEPDLIAGDQRIKWLENIERHPNVDEAIKQLREDPRVRGTALDELVDLVDSKLLLVNPRCRLEADKMAKELRELVERCNAAQTPWANHEAPPEVPELFRQETRRESLSSYQ